MSELFSRRALVEKQMQNTSHTNDSTAAVISLLQSLLSSDAAERRAAELTLAQAVKQTGFALALVQTILQQEYDVGVRQMAAVLLKQHVKVHWAEESKHFSQPKLSDNEKAAIRHHLPQGLTDPLPKLRTGVSMAIAAIAKRDLPDAWPELLNLLMSAVTTKENQNLGMQPPVNARLHACMVAMRLSHTMPCMQWTVVYGAYPCLRTSLGRSKSCRYCFTPTLYVCYTNTVYIQSAPTWWQVSQNIAALPSVGI